MPLPGTKPAETKRRRNKDTHEWVEVDEIPFEDAPRMPRVQPDGKPWSPWTKGWWKAISRMPHCVLWDDADWRFAMETAVVAAKFHAGDVKAATELRNREKVLGTTMDFRRDLRIRYMEPSIEVPAGITAIDEYRKMLNDD